MHYRIDVHLGGLKNTRLVIPFAVGNYNGVLWQVIKNDLGIPLRKFVTPDIHIACKFQDDCYVGYARLWQEYIGAGKYGTLIVGGGPCNSCSEKNNCNKAK